jgi:Uma2 family endonuclease
VVCGGTVSPSVDRDAYVNPTVLFEVLSPSTEGYDRGEKFRRCRSLESLRAYVLLSTHTPLVEVFTRAADDTWAFRAFGPGQVVPLDCIGVSLPVDELYGGITLDPPPRPPPSRQEDAPG